MRNAGLATLCAAFTMLVSGCGNIHPLYGDYRSVGPAIRLSRTPLRPPPLAPALGADTTALLAELGYAPEYPLETAIRGIEDVWLSLLRYRYFEAHTTRVAPDEAVLDFITQIDADGFFVTGRVRVTPGRS